jgi:hypothetical protein
VSNDKRAADDAEREAFEAWAVENGWRNFTRVNDGYAVGCLDDDWNVWRAALSARADGGKDGADAYNRRLRSQLEQEWCDVRKLKNAYTTPQAECAPVAFQALKDALLADDGYAWSWHCNLAMPIMDSIHCTPEQANKAGADLMKYLFSIDVRKFKEWHHDDPQAECAPREAQPELQWAVSRWEAEVKNRPLVNVHRRTLDETWRQVIRHFGGEPTGLVGPSHAELIAREKQ